MDQFKVIQGQRTYSSVFHHKPTNYIYKRVCEKNDIVYLKCIRKLCPGKARFTSTEVFASTHDHPADFNEVQKLKLLSKIKERVATETTPIHDIFVQECAKAECSEDFIKFKSIVGCLNRLRKKSTKIDQDHDQDYDEEITAIIPGYDAIVYQTSIDSPETFEEFDDDNGEPTYENKDETENDLETTNCPICDEVYPTDAIEIHVDHCLKKSSAKIESDPPPPKKRVKRKYESTSDVVNFSNLQMEKKDSVNKQKSNSSGDWGFLMNSKRKKRFYGGTNTSKDDLEEEENEQPYQSIKKEPSTGEVVNKPLSEIIRPKTFDEFIGEESITGPLSTVRSMVLGSRYCSTILWGPPGCGKTTLANIIEVNCKTSDSWRFTKLSACTSNVQEVKSAVQAAKSAIAMTKKKTIIFMDEIHRFNKAQQDVFLPHVESGLITLIGATTENPSFSLNSALLSRCRVMKLEALSPENVLKLIIRALDALGGKITTSKTGSKKSDGFCTFVSVDEDNIMAEVEMDELEGKNQSWFEITEEAVRWLAGGSRGDARVAINSLQPLISTIIEGGNEVITIEHVQAALKDNPTLYDRKGDEHYAHASALQKSIRGSDDNAAIYWTMRMIQGGEDPMFIARRLVRIASEDVGLGDPSALGIAVSALEATKNIGMPEADVILCQCAVYLARAPKNPEVYAAVNRIKSHFKSHMGELPPVPIHLRNASTKLMKDMGYGEGYTTDPNYVQNISYMPDALKNCNFLNVNM